MNKLYFYQKALEAFSKDKMCSCSKKHALGDIKIYLGKGVLSKVTDHLGNFNKIWILSDENTEKAGGKKLKSLIPAHLYTDKILPGHELVVPTLELCNELKGEVEKINADLLISVGSGVISDIVKKISSDLKIPNWCAATAPSVDAYTSITAAIRIKGYHKALPIKPTDVIFCDIDVIKTAPQTMFLSGVGDLLAKYISYFDWKLGHFVTGEEFCEALGKMSMDSARQAIKACGELDTDEDKAYEALTDALLTSGLMMQAWEGSRPAASSEHVSAHMWEMVHGVKNKELDFHGILVGAASKIVHNIYSQFYNNFPNIEWDINQRLEILKNDANWESFLTEDMGKNREKISMELKDRDYSVESARKRLENLVIHKAKIVETAQIVFAELYECITVLEGIDFPFSLKTIDIEEQVVMNSFKWLRLLRDRFSSFYVFHDIGYESQIWPVIESSIQSQY